MSESGRSTSARIVRTVRLNRDQMELHLLVLPGLLLLVLFKFVPIYGLQLAFKNLVPGLGIWESPWIGLRHFRQFFGSSESALILRNTFVISALKIAVGFPLPILLALLINELRLERMKSSVQAISFTPHFMSWVICAGIWLPLLARDGGVVNGMLLGLGLVDEPVHFMGEENLFWGVLVTTETWKETGWNTIVYTAAISAIDPVVYDAARIDGATRTQQIFRITLPSILPTIVVMFILRVGYILDAGFEQVLVFRNPMVYDVATILDTHVYDTGILHGRYGYATAIGLLKSVVGFAAVWLVNGVARRNGMGIWE